jgi:hypothetical protein
MLCAMQDWAVKEQHLYRHMAVTKVKVKVSARVIK